MQLYEIRRLRDGTIDRSGYYARPVSLSIPKARRVPRQAAAPKLWLVMTFVTCLMLAGIPILAMAGGQ